MFVRTRVPGNSALSHPWMSRIGRSRKLSIDALSAHGIFGLEEMKDMNL